MIMLLPTITLKTYTTMLKKGFTHYLHTLSYIRFPESTFSNGGERQR